MEYQEKLDEQQKLWNKAVKRERFVQLILWSAKLIFSWLVLSVAIYGVIWMVLLSEGQLEETLNILNNIGEERQQLLQGIEEWTLLLGGFFVFAFQVVVQFNRERFGRVLFLLGLGCLGVSLISTSYAELRVISDLGGESAVRFYEPIQPVHTSDAPAHHNAVPATLSEENMLPVVSHKFSVGNVQPRALDLPGAAPMFLLGADDVSRRWLAQNKDKLASIHAIGLVINVQTLDELKSLRLIAPELELLPAPADTLSDRLGLHHYPVIISAEGISQ